MNNENLGKHITQSKEWGEFKSLTGKKAVRVGDIQFTKHKIPFLPYYVGYAPRVNFNKQNFSWNELKNIAKSERCAFIRFDIPNVINDGSNLASNILNKLNDNCKKSPKSTFAKYNVLLDISPDEETLISNMHSKTRYNSRLAARKGVVVKVENNDEGFKTFYKLISETAKRQQFLIHPENYYRYVYETLSKYEMANILIAYKNNEPLSAWMLLNNGNTLYYPYGGSSNTNRNLMASNLIAWESIKFGKKIGCTLFDMWGATNDENSNWWGFTKFKIGYGGELVEYIDSYDFVVNGFIYHLFNKSYAFFWKLIDIIKRRKN